MPPSHCLPCCSAGYTDEAKAWREWLLRAVAGDPASAQIMYGLAGERRLTEWEVPWLPGYENSKPVRIGNAAHQQFQLDVYGEVADAMYHSRRAGLKEADDGWNLELAFLQHLAKVWEYARRRHLGGPRPSAALHPLKGHGLGPRSPGP